MCSDYWEKWKTICPEIQVAFEHKVAPDIDGFTDEPVVKCGSSSLSCRKYFSIWFQIIDTNGKYKWLPTNFDVKLI